VLPVELEDRAESLDRGVRVPQLLTIEPRQGGRVAAAGEAVVTFTEKVAGEIVSAIASGVLAKGRSTTNQLVKSGPE
jgi:hypothetical protein